MRLERFLDESKADMIIPTVVGAPMSVGMLNYIRKIAANAKRQKGLCDKLNVGWLEKAKCVTDINLSTIKIKEDTLKKFKNKCETERCRNRISDLLSNIEDRKEKLKSRLKELDQKLYDIGA